MSPPAQVVPDPRSHPFPPRSRPASLLKLIPCRLAVPMNRTTSRSFLDRRPMGAGTRLARPFVRAGCPTDIGHMLLPPSHAPPTSRPRRTCVRPSCLHVAGPVRGLALVPTFVISARADHEHRSARSRERVERHDRAGGGRHEIRCAPQSGATLGNSHWLQ